MIMGRLLFVLALLVPAMSSLPQLHAQPAKGGGREYALGAGDIVKITVFQNQDLSIETRVSESGSISYPLLGVLPVGGLSATQAERLIAGRLEEGGFLRNPQVTLNVTQYRSQQVSVLGSVNRPGRYALENAGMRLSEVLALAGGTSPNGGDTVILSREENGAPRRIEIDVADMFLRGDLAQDLPLRAGDVVYVHRAPVFYIYGQVNRPGMYTVERGMTIAQAIAKGGGVTLRGTEKGVRLKRRALGAASSIEPALDDAVVADDLIFVRESLF